MKADEMFFYVVISIIRLFYPVLLKIVRHFKFNFVHFLLFSFYVFDLETPFSITDII